MEEAGAAEQAAKVELVVIGKVFLHPERKATLRRTVSIVIVMVEKEQMVEEPVEVGAAEAFLKVGPLEVAALVVVVVLLWVVLGGVIEVEAENLH